MRWPLVWRLLAVVPLCLGGMGCDRIPGKPDPAERWQPPSAQLDFVVLYATHCRACHSDGEGLAASINLADPNYAVFVDPAVLRRVTEAGVVGTGMPGFGEAKGGPLTGEQVTVLVEGILKWGHGRERPADMPPYAAVGGGDVERGKAVYQAACAGCHGPDGNGLEGHAGSIVNPAYLRLVSDQYLRTVVVLGRPELGHPGYRDLPVGRPLTAEEVDAVVAWMAAQRLPEVGSLPPPSPDAR